MMERNCKNCKNPDCFWIGLDDEDICDEFLPKTNADYIRSMTNAELARFFDNIETKNYFGDYLGELGWLEWLKEERE